MALTASVPTLDFRGWRVAVAGGSKGIGRAMALAFAQAGAAVSVCARGAEALAHTHDALLEAGHPVHVAQCDLADPAAATAWIAGAASALGGLDVLVNNASGYGFADDDASWLAGFNVDLMTAVRAVRAATPHLARSPHASILNTCSIAARHPRRDGAPYAAVKAALASYTGSLALQLAPQRIRVNAIAPGSVDFPDGLWDRCHRDDPARYAAVQARIPFSRYGTPDDIAHVALFLASPLAGWVTGQVLAVDGGQGLNG